MRYEVTKESSVEGGELGTFYAEREYFLLACISAQVGIDPEGVVQGVGWDAGETNIFATSYLLNGTHTTQRLTSA